MNSRWTSSRNCSVRTPHCGPLSCKRERGERERGREGEGRERERGERERERKVGNIIMHVHINKIMHTYRRYQDEINNRPCKFNHRLTTFDHCCIILKLISFSSLSSSNHYSNKKFLSSTEHLQYHSCSQCHKYIS